MSLVFEGWSISLQLVPQIRGKSCTRPQRCWCGSEAWRNYKVEAEYCSLCDIKGSYLPECRRRCVLTVAPSSSKWSSRVSIYPTESVETIAPHYAIPPSRPALAMAIYPPRHPQQWRIPFLRYYGLCLNFNELQTCRTGDTVCIFLNMLAYVESRPLMTSECIPIDALNRGNHLLKTLALVGER